MEEFRCGAGSAGSDNGGLVRLSKHHEAQDLRQFQYTNGRCFSPHPLSHPLGRIGCCLIMIIIMMIMIMIMMMIMIIMMIMMIMISMMIMIMIMMVE